MSYETLQTYSQLAAGAIFLSVLIGAAIYAFRPANKARFERAARLPLESGAPNKQR